jgi:O-antigen/teichoic acid export membrane protein
MLRILIRNIVSNWIGFAVQAAVAFFLTPFVLHSLGDTRYGIWSLVIGLTGYYGLLDLGFRSGITQYLTRHLATRDFDGMNRTASTALVALASCGSLIALASGVLSWLAPLIFTIPADAVAETRWCIVVIGCSTGLGFVFFPFSAVFAATQRYDMANVIGIGTRLATAGATLAALNSGYGLAGLCVVNASGDLLGYVLRWRVAYRILPELRVSVRLAARRYLWPIMTFGLWSLIAQGAVQLKSCSSSLMIGIFLPMAAIAPFALAIGLLTQFEGFLQPTVACRFLRVPVRTYLSRVYLRPLVFGGFVSLMGFLHLALPGADSWSMLFYGGLIAAGVAGAFAMAIGLDGGERGRLIGAPAIGLLCRLGFRRPLDARVDGL